MNMDSLEYHKKLQGKIEVISRAKISSREELSLAYTPGVAEPCLDIAKDVAKVYDYTRKGNLVAVITDGTAVLGLGDIGPEAGLPVMEGKCALLKEFAGVDAFPICINSQDTEEIIKTIKNIEPVFGGINLEDISAPRCFEIEERLRQELSIPVMHDDQWGAAVVTIAALINALKVVKKNKSDVSVALVGAGAAGLASAKLLEVFKIKNLTVFDSKGAISLYRSDLNSHKKDIAYLNKLNIEGKLEDNMHHFDVFIGLSKPNLLSSEMVSKMKEKPIIFALANPTPEIMPDEAKKGGATVVGTGRSDFPNQINNSLFFPGFWAGMLKRKNKDFDNLMLIRCAEAIAKLVKPTADKILPSTLDKAVHKLVQKTIERYN
jgi:malate dehydrogenase (oxaloacetate-decarboxylating)